MKKYFMHKFLTICLIVVTGSCSAKSVVDKAINCNKRYTAISNQLNTEAEKKDTIKINNDIEIAVSKLLQTCPTQVGFRLIMVDIKVSQGNNSGALNYVDDALRIEPNNAQAIHTKGFIMSLLGNSEMSLAMMKKALNLEPDNIDYLVNYCSTLELFSKYKDAIAICSQAAKHSKAPSVVYYIRGRSYESLGKNKEAKQDYDMAKKLGFSIPK